MAALKERLVSLDVFRGLTMAGMVIVNNPGHWEGTFPLLKHSSWNGCTPTDLVFPFFLFMVGMSVSFSLGKKKIQTENKFSLFPGILKRAVILFLLGFLLNFMHNHDFETIRIMGVLQRIGIVFAIISILYLFLDGFKLTILGVSILLGYWLLQWGSEYLGYWNIYIDSLVLGKHNYEWTKTFDPEGILSTIPALVTGIIGIITGEFLKKDSHPFEKLTIIFLSGIVLVWIGAAWDYIHPINKSLWTSSYVVYTAGFALEVFGICYLVCDYYKKETISKPFIVLGTNAILLYLLSEVFSFVSNHLSVAGLNIKGLIVKNVLLHFFDPSFASLSWSILFLTYLFLLIYIFYLKKIFLKV